MSIVWVNEDDQISAPQSSTGSFSIRGLLTEWGAMAVIGGAIYWGIAHGWKIPDNPPSPLPPAPSSSFVELGARYGPEMCAAYAKAWDSAAPTIESTGDVGAALDLVGKSWESGRTSLFTSEVSPEFVKIVPEGTAPSDVTDQQRADLAKAWREFAEGLRSIEGK